MTDMKCPLGEDCDFTLAWMMGAERAKDTIKAQAAENERLRAALEYIAEGGLAYPEKHARAALEEK